MDSIDLKNAKSVLIRLSELPDAKKQDLFDIVKSHQVLDNLLNALEEDGYLTISVNPVGPKRYTLNLTEKGRLVAIHLKKTDEVAKGATLYEDEGRIEVRPPEEWKEKWKNLHALFHVNVYEDHVTIMEASYEGRRNQRIFNIYIRENGQGRLRLWCEEDESFDCYHVGYALTLAPVQEMFVRIRGGR